MSGIYPRKIKGFRDIDEKLNQLRWHIIEKATEVYKKYGYEHWDTPILEYAEALGKYLPESNSVADGVYSFKNPEIEPVFDEKGQEKRDANNNVIMTNHYVTMRYDLTAPLARLYSELIWQKYLNNQISEGKADLLRRYQFGPVFRFEQKLDPGRFREFWQLDFDTVGSNSIATDAENCMILSDALENIGLQRENFIVKVNNRKIIKGLLENIEISGEKENDVMRIIDKLDKIGFDGIILELGKGRTDEKSKAFIQGISLDNEKIQKIKDFFITFDKLKTRKLVLESLQKLNISNQIFQEGLKELKEIDVFLEQSNYFDDRVIFEPSLIRGMGYYTGPIFEVEYLGTYKDAKGNKRQVGSICGGGRYDGLVENLIGLKVPATGASIGVDRLAEIMMLTNIKPEENDGPIFIANFDEKLMPIYQKIAYELREKELNVEVYYGDKKGLKQQLAYADKKNCPIAIFLGEDEYNKGVVSLRNLKLGKFLADKVTDKKEWTAQVQCEVPKDDVIAEVLIMLI